MSIFPNGNNIVSAQVTVTHDVWANIRAMRDGSLAIIGITVHNEALSMEEIPVFIDAANEAASILELESILSENCVRVQLRWLIIRVVAELLAVLSMENEDVFHIRASTTGGFVVKDRIRPLILS
jgi:hypothetical protein